MYKFMKEKVLNWLGDVGRRTVKTMAEVALGHITVGVGLGEIKWVEMLSVAAVAGIYTILFNLKKWGDG